MTADTLCTCGGFPTGVSVGHEPHCELIEAYRRDVESEIVAAETQ